MSEEFDRLNSLRNQTFNVYERAKLLDAMLPLGNYDQLNSLRNITFNADEREKIFDTMLPLGSYDQLNSLRNITFNADEREKIFDTMLTLEKAKPNTKVLADSQEKLTCFICYGDPDEAFAKKLKNALDSEKIKTWIYSMDNTPGRRTWQEIIDNRRASNKVLVICSKASLKRDGTLKEIEQQIDENPEKIIPISIELSWTESNFTIKRGAADLKPSLLERNYADFTSRPFNEALDRLVNAIREC